MVTEIKTVPISNIVKMLRNGQVTIPEETRKFLGIKPGDLFKITIEKELIK